MGKSDILLVGQTPPPLHGQAVVTAMLFEHDWQDLKVERLRMSYSDTIDSVGKVSLYKVAHLLSLILKTWMIVLARNPKILYYLPASANKAPVLRDVIYLCCVRWLFPKIVYHYHAGGLPEFVESAGWLGRVAQKVYGNADLSIEICRTERSPGRIFSAKQTVYIPNGLDVELMQRGERHDNKFRVLFLGALNEGKGVLDVVRTAKIARLDGQQLEVQFVGSWASPDFQIEAEALVHREGLKNTVLFSGPLSGRAKWQAYADADLFIFPSHYQSENFPLVIIEAMAFGLPTVSTVWRGIPQLVGNSGAAILCDIKSPDQYARAIETIVQDPHKREEMSQAALEHYENHYTRERFVSAIACAFKKLLDPKV